MAERSQVALRALWREHCYLDSEIWDICKVKEPKLEILELMIPLKEAWNGPWSLAPKTSLTYALEILNMIKIKQRNNEHKI